MDSVRKMVEEHLPSLLREDGLRNNDLMGWLGVIQIPLEVEAIVRVGYRGIRACLEEVDQTILGGEGQWLKDQKPGIGMYCIRYRTCFLRLFHPQTTYSTFALHTRIIWAGTNAISNT
jgi:hypothetical protein